MQGDNVGRRWPSEMIVSTDPVSGATVRQLTSYRGHSNHAYFTYRCWYDDGRKLVIASDRENRTNLFAVDLESGELTQLTDCKPGVHLGRMSLIKNPAREEIYFPCDRAIQALDLVTLQTRTVFAWPDGYNGGLLDATADGRHLVTGFVQDLSDRLTLDLGHGYVGFPQMHAARPHSMIFRIPIDAGRAEMIYEEDYWLGHFNASPTLANIATFCHEGPWDRVDNRIWGLDINDGRTWKIRPTGADEAIGHEYWMTDGEHIGYHGRTAEGSMYGSIRYDDTERVEAAFDGNCWHFHSHMLDLIIGDGDAKEPYLLAWRLRDGRFEGPRVLAWHRGSFHAQALHVHPAVHDGGRKVLYSADPQAYGQVFIVDVPEFEAMPALAEVKQKRS